MEGVFLGHCVLNLEGIISSMSGICIQGVCVFDQECEIFFLMEYVFPVRNLSQECLFPDQERAE
jgi:hypothetical protein